MRVFINGLLVHIFNENDEEILMKKTTKTKKKVRKTNGDRGWRR